MPCALAAAEQEQMLWAGQVDTAALEALCDSPLAAERAWACYALARWRAGHGGDWAAAHALLTPPDVAGALMIGFGLLPAVVFMLEATIRAGDQARAISRLAEAKRVFGPRPELQLMAANLCISQPKVEFSQEKAQKWSTFLRPIYAQAGLAVPVLQGGETQAAPLFDRLTAARPGRFRAALQGLQPIPHAKVSVLMPMRNAALTLDTALRSLCGQSWRDLEILVIDNGSTDASLAIAQAWVARDTRIRLLDASADPGAYGARNIGLAAAQGDVITVQDADDWAHPAKIERQLRALLAQDDRQASVSHWVRATPDLGFTNWRADVGLIHRNVSSLMIRRRVQQRLGFWDRVQVGADSEYYLRLRAVWGPDAVVEVLPGVPLSFGRQSAEGLTQQKNLGLTSQFNGLRKHYAVASATWHDTLKQGEGGQNPYLRQYPDLRPFAINSALMLPPKSKTS